MKPGFKTGFHNDTLFFALSPKFKRVSLNETPEFYVDFDLTDSNKIGE